MIMNGPGEEDYPEYAYKYNNNNNYKWNTNAIEKKIHQLKFFFGRSVHTGIHLFEIFLQTVVNKEDILNYRL